MNLLKDYLSQMSQIRRSAAGVKETSYYGALETLLNEAGRHLKPKVRCIINLANKGAGIPDGGLFTPNQFQKRSNDLIEGQLPARGAIEVKGTGDEVDTIKDTEQVKKYLEKYGNVLVTNYRDLLLLTLDRDKQPKALERYSIAANETAFWDKADHFSATTESEAERLLDFLKRVMLYSAPIARPEDVAWFLASYAREARSRVEEADLHSLDQLKEALEGSLGIKFEGEKGGHFFRSTLVQTLFYGVFSGWVLWHKRKPASHERFQWRTAVWELKVPMINVLFSQIATPSNVRTLDLEEVLDWTENVLNRVVRGEFFARFAEDHAVQYFYEPFLEAFDPELRKQLGVWYTPEEIVRYMVERVDRVLREELNLADGLADETVYVLDPACGTGAYLVEVLKRINATFEEKGVGDLRGQKLKKAVMNRVFGFEILPAPFVVSHMQISLLLEQLGVGFTDGTKERAGVYLTNSLTGWDEHPKTKLPFPELEEERDTADRIKKRSPILVILGNPPYNAFAGVSPDEELGLVEPYKEGLIKDWGIKKFNLDDLYVRFFRLAERKIAEQTGKGIVCFISNYSWTSEPSFVVMRKKVLEEFDKIWIENMHGNRKITEYAPDGRTSETVFAIKGFSSGIQQGVTISTLVRKPGERDPDAIAEVYYRDDIADAKADERRHHLLETLDEANFQEHYEKASPDAINRFSLRPGKVSDEYQSWPKLDDLSEITPITGYKENRGFAMIVDDRETLRSRMRKYFEKSVSWEALSALDTGLTRDAARFDSKLARDKVPKSETYSEDRIMRYALRPFETKWTYYCPIRPLWNEPRPALYQHHCTGNRYLISRPASYTDPEGIPFFLTGNLADFHLLRGQAHHIPFRLHVADKLAKDGGLFADVANTTKANLSETARRYLESVGITDADENAESAALIWYHALAIGYSPEYLSENADGIRQDFPRIPLPASGELLRASARLGERIAALLDTENEVDGVTVGKILPELAALGVASHTEGKQFTEDDLRVTAGWGHAGKNGVTMPGKGRVEKGGNPNGSEGATDEASFDIYLNDFAYWRNVPVAVWEYYIGGYQVVKKWLSYREYDLLGRPLKLEEVEEVTNMIRRIAAIISLTPNLDANYTAVKDQPFK